jgi:hypothetical protein
MLRTFLKDCFPYFTVARWLSDRFRVVESVFYLIIYCLFLLHKHLFEGFSHMIMILQKPINLLHGRRYKIISLLLHLLDKLTCFYLLIVKFFFQIPLQFLLHLRYFPTYHFYATLKCNIYRIILLQINISILFILVVFL